MTQLRTAVAARLPIKSALGYMVPNDQPPKKVLRSKFCKELFFFKRDFFLFVTLALSCPYHSQCLSLGDSTEED